MHGGRLEQLAWQLAAGGKMGELGCGGGGAGLKQAAGVAGGGSAVRRVVAFSGKRKSGKDFICEQLQTLFGDGEAEIGRLSSPLKKAFADEHGAPPLPHPPSPAQPSAPRARGAPRGHAWGAIAGLLITAGA